MVKRTRLYSTTWTATTVDDGDRSRYGPSVTVLSASDTYSCSFVDWVGAKLGLGTGHDERRSGNDSAGRSGKGYWPKAEYRRSERDEPLVQRAKQSERSDESSVAGRYARLNEGASEGIVPCVGR